METRCNDRVDFAVVPCKIADSDHNSATWRRYPRTCSRPSEGRAGPNPYMPPADRLRQLVVNERCIGAQTEQELDVVVPHQAPHGRKAATNIGPGNGGSTPSTAKACLAIGQLQGDKKASPLP
jgi:hypothetical protein